MIVKLVRLECVRLGRDRRVMLSMCVFAAVLLVAGCVAAVDVHRNARVKARVAADERSRWLGQGERDPHSAAHYSIYAFRSSLPLEAVDRGVVPFVGQSVWLEAHHQNDLSARPQQDTTSVERMGLLDPAGLLIRLGPLAVFLSAFATAGQDRTGGVLGLAIGLTNRRRAFVGAKVASVTVVSAAALIVPVVMVGAGSIGASASPVVEAVGALAVWALAGLAYVGVLALIGVSVCMIARGPHVALATLLLVWVSMAPVALPGATVLAELIRPLPSFQAMKLVVQEEAPAYWSHETGAQQVAAILEKYGATDEAGLQINLRGAQLDLAERHAQAVFDREIGGFHNRVEAQDRLYAYLGWLSPAVAFATVSATAAGTDFASHRRFVDAAEHYRRDLVNRMNADLILHPAKNGRVHTNDLALWSQVPAFEPPRTPFLIAARPALPAVIALLGWVSIGSLVFAFTARRLRP